MELFKCSKCRQEKPALAFYAHAMGRSGLASWCKQCMGVYRKTYRASPAGKASDLKHRRSDRFKRTRLKRWLEQYYHITVEQYEALNDKQGGVCAICGQANRRGDRLCVDHCHKTGKVRGLLCMKCNTALGFLGDSPILVSSMAQYLRGE